MKLINTHLIAKVSVFSLIAIAAPYVVLAGDYLGGDRGLDGFFIRFNGFINNILIPFIFAVALLMFIYGMYRWFIQGGASDDDRQKGRQLALYSILGFVLMVSVWAIVSIISTGFFGEGVPPGTLPTPPQYNDGV